MTIEILQPDLESAIRQYMASGVFKTVDELLGQALASFEPPRPTPTLSEGESFLAVFDRMRGLLNDEEVDMLFTRESSPGRDIDLS